ncbi:MAG: Fpg/Nei family DNA glycosylase [Actinomycetia bacterium]|nr:Fpg/Nei family DNA glycosylase [Actinomycetes bacterium]
MPEVPELEGARSFLVQRITGTRIAEVQVGAISVVKTAEPPITSLRDAMVVGVQRVGKFLVLALAAAESTLGESGGAAVDSDGSDPAPQHYLATHLSRAGWLRWTANPPKAPLRLGRGPVAARLTFVSPDGEFVGALDYTEAGTQKRLALYLVSDLNQVPGIQKLGPDVRSDAFDETTFGQIVSAAGGQHLKTLLRDQTQMAGIGNAYSDEILHLAQLSPKQSAKSLTESQTATLYQAIQTTLSAAIDSALAIDDLRKLKDNKRAGFRVHARAGETCTVCGSQILSVATGDSSYEYCPGCQTKGKPLADHRTSRFLK